MGDASMQAGRVLYVVVCGAGPAAKVGTLVKLAQAAGWVVCVATTPAGAQLADIAELAKLTGRPVRTEYDWEEGRSRAWPLADTIVVAPATINTICKWAAGIADNLALSMLFECMGVDLPIVVAPNVNPALARHPVFQRSVQALRIWGVTVLYERSAPPPAWMASWEEILRALPPS
jgi:phosphopantothenoylcysteine synthetase/decarboxylase